MLQKRLDFGFNGYEVPFNFIPRAARSTRRRGPVRKKIVDNQMCAFDLLATVAGKLLLEGECSEDACCGKDQDVTVEDVVIKEQYDEGNQLNLEHLRDEKSELCSDLGFHLESRLPDMNEFVEHHDGVGEPFSGIGLDVHSSEDPKFFDRKPSALVTSDSSVRVSSGQKQLLRSCGLLPPSRGNNIKVVTRDDDDNSSECAQPSTKKTSRSRARIGDRRIRKLLASKYWRLAPKVKDGDFSDTEFRSVYRSWKIGYKRRRSQRMYPFKKRKFFHYSCKGVYNSREKAIGMTASGFGAVGHGVNGSSSCVAGQSRTFSSRESHVKLRIKSFRVPELFIDMPETATVGSLKRTVMEAVTALIGGGLQVGVLIQGNKIRDDNRTLLQSGVCHDDKVESLGFTLEPNPSHTSLPVCADDNSVVLSTDVTEPISRCPATSTILQDTRYVDPVTNMCNLIESDHDLAPTPSEISSEKGMVDSRALVALLEGTPQALAVVPVNQKSKESEIGQRRIRRPFSVAEVEALVEAVEKLGTGRWRDVKLRAFDNVNHRTYVDLKDKWKTLVHTARISPQQRRGQPVPQNLLDRVLTAHANWSQLQAKHHLKQHSEACCFL